MGHPVTLSVKSRGYSAIVNVDPLTGVPAVLGEVTAERQDLDACGSPWDPVPAVSLLRWGPRRPELFEELRQVVEDRRPPTRMVVAFDETGWTILEEEALELPPEAAARYWYARWADGSVEEHDVLRGVPPSVLSLSRSRVAPANSEVPLGRGVPVSGDAAKGLLHPDRRAWPPPWSGRVQSFVVVDRVEAHHTVLMDDPDCAGLLARRGSRADHFAVLAVEKRFPYLILDGQEVDGERMHGTGGTAPFGGLITVDFSSGDIYRGDLPIETCDEPQGVSLVRSLLESQECPVAIRVNVDTAEDLGGWPRGAAGIGLLRTEHLLRRAHRENLLRQWLEATAEPDRASLVDELTTFFRAAFTRVLDSSAGRPVAVRLLDYPLHELGTSTHAEVNPMLGLRGVRQGLAWPAIYSAQLTSLFQAAAARRGLGRTVGPLEIIVPLVSFPDEVAVVRSWTTHALEAVEGASALDVRLGAMVETPAAVSVAGELAMACDVLSFGTNDLTQLVFGISREDSLPVIGALRQWGVLGPDPFEHLHPVVLDMVRDGAARARQANPSVTIGLCGIHAAGVDALELCATGVLDHVSVPVPLFARARLEAARLGPEASPAS